MPSSTDVLRAGALNSHRSFNDTPTNSLSEGAQLFVLSARHWAFSLSDKHCAGCLLRPIYESYGLPTALPIMNELMCFVSLACRRQLAISHPTCPVVTPDEMELLDVMRALQRNDPHSAYAAATGIFEGSLATTFFRIGRAYIAQLTENGLSVTGVRYLSEVATSGG
ncbi:MAG: hypothetical protein AAF270_10005 [Pseudomonadota bacterium]